MSSKIQIMDYDPLWPEIFRREADRVRALLGCQALRIEHTGSTSVPGLAAKPIIDILLVVADSSDEPAYVPILESAGYSLRIREPNWHEHRMFKGPAADINLHVFSSDCREINRILNFRDWLRSNAADREPLPVTAQLTVGLPVLYALSSAKGASSPRKGPCPP